MTIKELTDIINVRQEFIRTLGYIKPENDDERDIIEELVQKQRSKIFKAIRDSMESTKESQSEV